MWADARLWRERRSANRVLAWFFEPPARGWPPPRQPDETSTARALRYAADRRHLDQIDDRPLDDVGLDRESLRRGLPFQEKRRATQGGRYGA